MNAAGKVQVSSLAEAVAASQDALTLSERQPAPPFLDSAIASAAVFLLTLFAFSNLSLMIVWFVLLVAVGTVNVLLPWHRAVLLLAHSDYYLVVRSARRQLGPVFDWQSLNGGADVLAVVEREKDLRPEERAGVPANNLLMWREVVLLHRGVNMVLFQGRVTEDQGVEVLHRIRAFFLKHSVAEAGQEAAMVSKGSLR